MTMFAYTGQNSGTGKKMKGSIDADNLKDARAKLRKQGIYILEIREDQRAAAGAQASASLWTKLNRKPPTRDDIAMATKQFSVMIRAGVDVSEALRALSDQIDNAELRAVYIRIRELVSEGKSLSIAHREFPAVFDTVYVNMIAAAEKSGTLALTLRGLSDFLVFSIETRRKIMSALMMPAITIAVSILMVVFLCVKILPDITKALKSMKGVSLPWYTVMVNSFSAWLQGNWYYVLFLVIALWAAFYVWVRTPKGRHRFHEIRLRLPGFGPLFRKVAVSRFARTLATVLQSGVRIVEALQLSRNVVNDSVYERAIDSACVGIQDGENLAQALEKTKVFPTNLLHMVKTGQKTGKMAEMLQSVSDAYDEEVDAQIGTTLKAIQPVITLGLALVIGGLVLSVLGPMLEAMSTLK